MAITSEFRHGTIRSTFLVTPRRSRVIAAKVVASVFRAASSAIADGLSLEDLEGGLQHGEGEALRAIAVGLHVLALDGGEIGFEHLFVREPGQKLVETLVRQPEHRLRVPERIVRIDANDRE